MNRNLSARATMLAICLFVAASESRAQDDPFNVREGLGFPAPIGGAAEPIQIHGEFTYDAERKQGRVSVTAIVEPGWHTYSMTQNRQGAEPTSIEFKGPSSVKLTGGFEADHEPHHKEMPEIFPGVIFEEYSDVVTWSAPFELSAAIDPSSLEINLQVVGQVCDEGGCTPFDKNITAKLVERAQGVFEAEDGKIVWRGRIEPQRAAPGSTATLVLEATVEEPWHVYPYATEENSDANKPTLIVLGESTAFTVGAPEATPPPDQKTVDGTALAYHAGTVTWRIPLTINQDAAAGETRVGGFVGFQICTDSGCLAPNGLRFEVMLPVGESESGELPLTLTAGSYSLAAKAAAGEFSLDQISAGDVVEGKRPLAYVICIAFLGGFVLNFMPCVLPVIGLKVMSFVQQAGESRSRIFWLNFWYSAGLMSIFMVLATLAVVFSLGWGEQSQFSGFNITMAAIIFVMALSFLGIWEIPIPGFVGTSNATKYAEKEGASAAIVKGMVTTIMAVPCSGPGIATALAWCADKPSYLIYVVFFCMGLGMASPYLLIGMNPALVRFLPKPGAWMDTFKQLMGFLLLGTVVWILTYTSDKLLIPTIALLFGLWASVWWIGRTSPTAEFQVKLRAWLFASAFGALIGIFAFTALVEKDPLLAWEPYSQDRLAQEAVKKNTVMVDFTADW